MSHRQDALGSRTRFPESHKPALESKPWPRILESQKRALESQEHALASQNPVPEAERRAPESRKRGHESQTGSPQRQELVHESQTRCTWVTDTVSRVT